MELDRVDVRLLELLQEDGRISQNELARAVGLSAPAVAERVRKLEERGPIIGYRAVVDAGAVGLGLTAFVHVGVRGARRGGAIGLRVREMPEVLECHSVTGEGPYLLKVRTADTRALEALLATVHGWPGVEWTRSEVVLSTEKETTRVPLPESTESAGREEIGGGPVAADLLVVPFRHNP